MITVEIGVIGISMFGGHLFRHPPWSPQTFLDNNAQTYFSFALALVALNFSPLLAVWAGAVITIVWSTGFLWIALMPRSIIDIPPDATFDEALAVFHHLDFVDLDLWVQDVLIIAMIMTVMATVVLRARRLLARHFSPNMVDTLARQDNPLTDVRHQNVAVMFVDIVGYTRLSERLGADGTIAVLRDLHSRLERIVFEHDGTFDKPLGDGIIATFGTPEPKPVDAANALRAGLAVLDEGKSWNRQREGADPPFGRSSLRRGDARRCRRGSSSTRCPATP